MAWRWQEYLLKKELQIKTNNDNATHFLKYKASSNVIVFTALTA